VAIFLAAPWQAYPRRQVVDDFRIMDRSWQLDLPWELAHGRAVGPDFVFNYGILYQAVHALPLVADSDNVAALVRYHDLPEVALAVLAVWWMLGATGANLAWRLGVFAIWTLLLAAPVDFHATHLKPVAGLALFVACGKGVGRASETPGAPAMWPVAVIWFLGPPLIALYSFEFGLFCWVALFGFTAVAWTATLGIDGEIVPRLRRITAFGLVAATLGMACLALAFWRIPPLEHYLPDWYQLASHYAVAKSIAVQWWKFAGLATTFVLVTLAALMTAARIRTSARSKNRLAGELGATLAVLAAAVFSVLWLRYGLVRGGWSHFYRGTIPGMFTVSCLATCWLTATCKPSDNAHWPWPLSDWDRQKVTRLAATVAVVVMLPFALSHEFRANWTVRFYSLSAFDPRPARLELSGEPLVAAVEAIREEASPAVMVWPYEVMLGVLAEKLNPTWTLQSTSAHTARLQETIAERLFSKEPAAPVLVYRPSNPVDGVTHVTRGSTLFREFLIHYQLSAPPTAAYAMLAPRDRPQAWELELQAMPETAVAFEPGGNRGTRLALEDIAASDLIVLQLRVGKTRSWAIGKPGYLVARMQISDGTVRDRLLLVPYDGETHDVLISGIDITDPCFFTHFVPGREWRSTERVDSLTLTWQPMDALSRRPPKVELLEVGRLVRPGVETRESPLESQSDPGVWEWCYDQSPGTTATSTANPQPH